MRKGKLADLRARRLVPLYDLPRERVLLAKAEAAVKLHSARIQALEESLAEYDRKIAEMKAGK